MDNRTEWRGVEKLRETPGGRCAMADVLLREPEKDPGWIGQSAATEDADLGLQGNPPTSEVGQHSLSSPGSVKQMAFL